MSMRTRSSATVLVLSLLVACEPGSAAEPSAFPGAVGH